eukprot:3585767-Amphidinium_carterae.1
MVCKAPTIRALKMKPWCAWTPPLSIGKCAIVPGCPFLFVYFLPKLPLGMLSPSYLCFTPAQ